MVRALRWRRMAWITESGTPAPSSIDALRCLIVWKPKRRTPALSHSESMRCVGYPRGSPAADEDMLAEAHLQGVAQEAVVQGLGHGYPVLFKPAALALSRPEPETAVGEVEVAPLHAEQLFLAGRRVQRREQHGAFIR